MKRLKHWNTTSEAKVIKFVETNPGLTAAMIARLWRRPYGTMSAVLYNLVANGQLERIQSVGMKGGRVLAWRYYPNLNKAAVDAAFAYHEPA